MLIDSLSPEGGEGSLGTEGNRQHSPRKTTQATKLQKQFLFVNQPSSQAGCALPRGCGHDSEMVPVSDSGPAPLVRIQFTPPYPATQHHRLSSPADISDEIMAVSAGR